MNNKAKFIWTVVVLIALVFAGFLWYNSYVAKNKSLENQQTKSDASTLKNISDTGDNGSSALDQEDIDEEMENFNAQCEAGQWLKIADQSGSPVTASGKLRRVYPDDETTAAFKGYSYFVEGQASIALTGSDLSKLDYFEDREVEVQGTKSSGKNELAVSQVKCAGAETDKTVIDQRNNLMSYIAANINSIAPKKAKYEKWTADIVEFVDASHVYVEYYDTIDDKEDSNIDEDTTRRVLLETTAKPTGGYDAKVLAYWEMGEDDFALKEGADKFEDVMDTISYQYDPEKNKWDRID